MLAIVGAIVLGGAVFYIVYTTQLAVADSAAKERLALEWSGDGPKFVPPFYLKITKPLLKGAYLDMAAGFWSPARLAGWKKKLDAAGYGKFIQPEHFVAAKFWLALGVGALLFLNYLFGSNDTPVWVPIAASVFAFVYPNLDIVSKREARQFEIRISLPYVMDLLTLSMEAGKEFQGAVSKVVERSPNNPLIEELTEVLKDIQLGKSRSEALRKMADKVDISELTSLVAVIVSTDSMGVSIGAVLRAQAESLRAERLVKAEKLGAQASQKILFPLVIFILPAVFLMILGPVALGYLGIK